MNQIASWKYLGSFEPGPNDPHIPADFSRPYYESYVLSRAQCDALYHEVIGRYSKKQLSRVYMPSGVGSQIDLGARYTHYYDPHSFTIGQELDKLFNDAVSLACQQVWGKVATAVARTQLLGYEERCMFRTHADNSVLSPIGWVRNDPTRDISGILYVSEHAEFSTRPGQFSGGEFVFDNLVDEYNKKIVVKPKKGQLILFPSDPRFIHSVLPVTGGYRIAFVNWWKLS